METESKVDSYTTPLDAELARSYLESHGIRVRLEGEDLAGAAFGLGPMLGGVQLFVDHDAGERASSLLAHYHDFLRSPPAAQESQAQLVDRAFYSALLGLVTVPLLLHGYSLWLLLNVKRQPLTARAKQRYIVAWIANVAVVVVACWALIGYVRQR
jgi:cytochrome bd-type quinol oxidase subunit 2